MGSTASGARFQALLSLANDAIFLSEPGGRLIEVNQAACDRLGFSRAELLTMTAADINAPETAAQVPARTDVVMRQGSAVLETVHRRRDGTCIPVEVSARAIELDGRTVILSIARDISERRAADATLTASQARLRTVVDTMLEGVVVLSAVRDEGGRIVDFRIDDANPAIIRSSPLGPAERIGHTLLELFPADRTNGLFDAYVEVVETGVPFEMDGFHILDPDAAGGPLDQMLDLRAAKLGDGYVLSVRDVTERHVADLERERLVAAVEQSADGVIITDPEWRIVYANAVYAASVGREPSELVGRSATEVVSIGLDPDTVAAMFRTVSAGQRWATEVDHRFPDGSVHRFETNIGPIHDAAGAITSWVGVLHDITERHHAERAMRRLSTVIEQASDAVVITDTSGAIEYVNPAFEHVTGYTAAEVLGQNPRVLKSGVQGPGFYAAMWATLASGQSFVGDLVNRRKDGSLFQEEAVISPVRDEAGTITSYVAVKRDVT
ncbi:MAG: PAS domain S-box protein, partial [Candidatus Limnocylindrales bacterium]|nr:PAS domain S-box protein [Candidatus Limnocylindrales bacterium]